MSADKIERFREALTMRISQTMFDALIAAVREDEKARCIAAVERLYDLRYDAVDRGVTEAIKDA